MRTRSDHKSWEDRRLVHAAVAGDHRAAEVLFDRYDSYLHSVARRCTRSGDAAEEAVQAGRVAAFEKLSDLRDPNRFGPWAGRIVASKAVDEQRRTARQSPSDSLPDEVDVDLIETDDEHERLDRARRAFLQLPERHRQIVDLAVFKQLPIREVAAIMAVDVNTAHQLLHRARRNLRRGYLVHALPDDAPRACQDCNDRLLDYVRGKGTDRSRAAVDDHVETCAGCRVRLAEALNESTKFKAALAATPLAVVLAALRLGKRAVPGPLRAGRRTAKSTVAVSGGFAVVAAITTAAALAAVNILSSHPTTAHLAISSGPATSTNVRSPRLPARTTPTTAVPATTPPPTGLVPAPPAATFIPTGPASSASTPPASSSAQPAATNPAATSPTTSTSTTTVAAPQVPQGGMLLTGDGTLTAVESTPGSAPLTAQWEGPGSPSGTYTGTDPEAFLFNTSPGPGQADSLSIRDGGGSSATSGLLVAGAPQAGTGSFTVSVDLNTDQTVTSSDDVDVLGYRTSCTQLGFFSIRLADPGGTLAPGAHVRVEFADVAGTYISLDSTAVVNDGTWHRVQVSFNAQTDELALNVDGTATQVSVPPGMDVVAPNVPLEVANGSPCLGPEPTGDGTVAFQGAMANIYDGPPLPATGSILPPGRP